MENVYVELRIVNSDGLDISIGWVRKILPNLMDRMKWIMGTTVELDKRCD